MSTVSALPRRRETVLASDAHHRLVEIRHDGKTISIEARRQNPSHLAASADGYVVVARFRLSKRSRWVLEPVYYDRWGGEIGDDPDAFSGFVLTSKTMSDGPRALAWVLTTLAQLERVRAKRRVVPIEEAKK
jgi:hypothetical protein